MLCFTAGEEHAKMSHSPSSAESVEEPDWDDFFEAVRCLEHHTDTQPQRLGKVPVDVKRVAPQENQAAQGLSLGELGLLLDASFVEKLLFAEPQRRINLSKGMILVEEHLSEASRSWRAMTPRVLASPAKARNVRPDAARDTVAQPAPAVSLRVIHPVTHLENESGPIVPPPFLVEPPIRFREERAEHPDRPPRSRSGLLSTVGSLLGRPDRG